MRLTVEVEYLQAGQPRPYADSVYEANITITADDSGFGSRLGRHIVEKIARALVHNWEDEPHMLSSRLEQLSVTEQTDRGQTWRVRVVEPYCD